MKETIQEQSEETLTIEGLLKIGKGLYNKVRTENPEYRKFLDKYKNVNLKTLYSRNLFFTINDNNKEEPNGKKSKSITSFFNNGELIENWENDFPEYIEIRINNSLRLIDTKEFKPKPTPEILNDLNDLQTSEILIENPADNGIRDYQTKLYEFLDSNYKQNSEHGALVFFEALDAYLSELAKDTKISKADKIDLTFKTLVMFYNKTDPEIDANNASQKIIQSILEQYRQDPLVTKNEAEVLLFFVQKFVKEPLTTEEIENGKKTKQALVNDIVRKFKMSTNDLLNCVESDSITIEQFYEIKIGKYENRKLNNGEFQEKKIIIRNIINTILKREEDQKNNGNISIILGDLIIKDQEVLKEFPLLFKENFVEKKRKRLGYYEILVEKLLLKNYENFSHSEINLIKELIPLISKSSNEKLKITTRSKVRDLITNSKSQFTKFQLLKNSLNSKLIEDEKYLKEQSEEIIKNLESEKTSFRTKVGILTFLSKKGILQPNNDHKTIIRKIIQKEIKSYKNMGDGDLGILLEEFTELSKENVFKAEDYGDDLKKNIFICLVKNGYNSEESLKGFFKLFPGQEIDMKMIEELGDDQNLKAKFIILFLNNLYKSEKPENTQEILKTLENKEIQDLFLNPRNAKKLIKFIDNFAESQVVINNTYSNKLGYSPRALGKATMNINQNDKTLVDEGLGKYPKIRALKTKLQEVYKKPPKSTKANQYTQLGGETRNQMGLI